MKWRQRYGHDSCFSFEAVLLLLPKGPSPLVSLWSSLFHINVRPYVYLSYRDGMTNGNNFFTLICQNVVLFSFWVRHCRLICRKLPAAGGLCPTSFILLRLCPGDFGSVPLMNPLSKLWICCWLLNNDDCLQDNTVDYQNCSVSYCVSQ